MDILIKMGIIIGALIIGSACIKILLLIFAGLLYLYGCICEFRIEKSIKKSKKEREEKLQKYKEKATKIIKIFEKFLSKQDIKYNNEFCIKEKSYCDLEESIVEILDDE